MVSRIEGLVSDLAARRLRLGYNENEANGVEEVGYCFIV